MNARACMLVLTSVWAFACDDPNVAKEPVWNKQPCDHCHMVLSDPRYAAQLSSQSDERRYFDDIGCLAAFMVEHKLTHAHAWVHDASGWRGADQTRYARGAQTPMGYGFVPDARGGLDFAELLRGATVQAANLPAGAP
jgi:copper chaperone NosL